jgi:hypothetical protein
MTSYLSRLSTVPTFSPYTGPHRVGTIDIELPTSELESLYPAPKGRHSDALVPTSWLGAVQIDRPELTKSSELQRSVGILWEKPVLGVGLGSDILPYGVKIGKRVPPDGAKRTHPATSVSEPLHYSMISKRV